MIRRLFQKSSDPDIWLSDSDPAPEKYVLVTVSGKDGEKTVLASSDNIFESKAKHFVQAPKERVVKGSDLYRQKLFMAAKGLGYVLIVVLLSFSVLSFADVTKARVVLTGSMKPTIQPGDVVLSLNPDRLPPKVGDVVTYTARRFDGSAVTSFTHRIISGDEKSGFVVKGDNNPAPDTQKPKLKDITGVIFFTIPLIGKLLTPKGLMILVPCLFGLWLIIDSIKNEN